MKISERLLAAHKRGPTIFSDGRTLSHRMLVIQCACDLEVELCDLLVTYARKAYPSISEKQTRDYLLGDGRPFDSLKRAADAAAAFGLISAEENSDIKILGRMRDRYAHDRDRRQLDDDPAMLSKLHSLQLWKSNPELHAGRPQEALRCIVAHLLEVIRARISAIVPTSET